MCYKPWTGNNNQLWFCLCTAERKSIGTSILFCCPALCPFIWVLSYHSFFISHSNGRCRVTWAVYNLFYLWCQIQNLSYPGLIANNLYEESPWYGLDRLEFHYCIVITATRSLIGLQDLYRRPIPGIITDIVNIRLIGCIYKLWDWIKFTAVRSCRILYYHHQQKYFSYQSWHPSNRCTYQSFVFWFWKDCNRLYFGPSSS